MEKKKVLDINQIIRYTNNEMSKHELIAFEKLLEDENNLNKFKKYLTTDHYIQLSKHDFDEHKAFKQFQKQIRSTKPLRKQQEKRNNGYLKYAAVFITMLIGAATYFLNKSLLSTDQNNTQITIQLDDDSPKVIRDNELFKEIKTSDGAIVGVQEKSKIVYNNNDGTTTNSTTSTLRVPNGKKFQLVLSDGTIVNVNAGSTLKFPTQFTSNQVREVELIGEAYFEVARNENAPFIVSTNGIKTEVLGTKFNVSSYGNDSFSEVVLVEGSVGIFKDKERFDKNKDQKLKPSQKATLLNSQKKPVISNVKAENYIAWIEGVLLFKNESFESIVKKLERFYDKKITINYQKLKNEKFTGTFDIENIEEVLNTFKSNTDFNVTYKGSEIIINP